MRNQRYDIWQFMDPLRRSSGAIWWNVPSHGNCFRTSISQSWIGARSLWLIKEEFDFTLSPLKLVQAAFILARLFLSSVFRLPSVARHNYTIWNYHILGATYALPFRFPTPLSPLKPFPRYHQLGSCYLLPPHAWKTRSEFTFYWAYSFFPSLTGTTWHAMDRLERRTNWSNVPTGSRPWSFSAGDFSSISAYPNSKAQVRRPAMQIPPPTPSFFSSKLAESFPRADSVSKREREKTCYLERLVALLPLQKVPFLRQERP